MSAYSLPYVIQCVELASQRASSEVHGQMKRRVWGLASIAAIASFVGFLGTVLGILSVFRSYGGSWSSIFADETRRISEAMVPGFLGLLVALLAFWFYQYLSDQLKAFDLEMRCASDDLVNRLVVHLGQLKATDAALWAALVTRPKAVGITADPSAARPPEAPQFSIGRMYRHGVLELIWPHLDSGFDADLILDTTRWICLGYGIIGYLMYWIQHRSPAGLIVFTFLASAGISIRRRSLGGLLSAYAFFAVAAVSCLLSSYSLGFGAVCCAAAPLPLVGSWKAVRWPGSGRSVSRTELMVRRLLFALLLSAAGSTVLFGTIFGMYPTQLNDNSMYPTIEAGDWLLGSTSRLTGPIYRTELLEVNVGVLGTLRVVGLPGDRVRIKAGELILNGVAVREPYCKPYPDALGDFPLPAEAYADEYLRSSHHRAYGERMNIEKAFIVPEGRYFMLNDNRRQLSDSRTMGPLSQEYVVGKLIARYPTQQSRWTLPRLLQ